MALVKGILISDWLGILLNSLSLSDINKEQKRPEVFVGNKKTKHRRLIRSRTNHRCLVQQSKFKEILCLRKLSVYPRLLLHMKSGQPGLRQIFPNPTSTCESGQKYPWCMVQRPIAHQYQTCDNRSTGGISPVAR